MSRRAAWLLLGLLAGAALSFLAARALRSGGDAGPLDPEAVASADALEVYLPVPFVGDFWETANAIGATDRERRETASAAGEVLEDSSLTVDDGGGYGFPDLFDFDWGESYEFGDEEASPEPDGSGVAPVPGDEEAADRAVDECTAEEPSDDCPGGVAGTILAIRSLPPLQATLRVDPFAPGTAPYNFWAECEPVESALGRVAIGVAANRPAGVTLEWRRYSPYGPRPVEPDGTMAMAASDAQEASWTAWAEDETAGYEDSRYWIDHCFVIDGLDPGTYAVDMRVVDRLDSGEVFRAPPQFFSVADEEGEVPVQERRPTVLLPWGIDRLLVGVTREPDQEVVVRARLAATTSSCDTGGDPSRVLRLEEGTEDGALAGESTIPRARRESPDYPYLPLHSIDAAYGVDLEEGSDYLLCLYWVRGGGRSVDIVEEIPVSTPDAYTPRVILHGVDDLALSGLEMQVSVPGFDCTFSGGSVEVPIGAHPGPVMTDPVTICSFDRGLSSVDVRGGFPVETSVMVDGEFHRRRSFVRTGPLDCAASPCLLRLNEMVRVPFPDVPMERRLCGSGWGSGCSDPVPHRTAGQALLEIVYDRSRSNGAADWILGVPAEFRDTPASQPRVTVDATAGPGGYVPIDGMRVDFVVRADRPVSLTARVLPETGGRPVCLIAGLPEPFESPELLGEHRFAMEGLCVGERYLLEVGGTDEGGNPLVVVVSRFSPPGSTRPFWLSAAALTVENEVTVSVPDDGSEYTIGVDMGSVAVPRLDEMGVGGGGLGLGDRMCIDPGSDPVTFTGESWALVNQTDLVITATVQIRRNYVVGGPVLRECVPDEEVASYTLSATVSLADLAAGVTIVSDDGVVVYRARISSFVAHTGAV